MNDSQALAQCVTYLLQNATQESTWGDSQTDWDPIITALTCKLLLSCGLTPNTVWYINRNGYFHCTLSASFQWLNNSISPDGKFGTDFWDTAQLGILIETYSLQHHFTAYDSLKKHLIRSIESRGFQTDPSNWQGPAFCVTAIAYLRLLGKHDHTKALERDLAKMQHSGCWQGHSGASGIPFAVWHTAQCIILLADNPKFDPDLLAKSTQWLVNAQHGSGAWVSIQQYNVYFTSYAVLALLHDKAKHAVHIQSAIDYLRSQMAPNGKCSDLGGTLMCGMAFRAVVGDSFEKDITLIDYLLAKENTNRAEASEHAFREQELELTQAKKDLSKWEAKYGEAEFAITKKGLFVLALVALFLAILGNVTGDILNSIVQRTFLPPPTQLKQQPPEAASAAPLQSGDKPSPIPVTPTKPQLPAPQRHP